MKNSKLRKNKSMQTISIFKQYRNQLLQQKIIKVMCERAFS